MVPASSAPDADEQRAFQPRLPSGQGQEIDLVCEQLPLWPNRSAFIREAINRHLEWAWGLIEKREAREAALQASPTDDRPRDVHDLARRTRR